MAQTVSAIDLLMMVTIGGRERAAAEHRGMLAAAGFVIARILPTQSEMSVMERLPA